MTSELNICVLGDGFVKGVGDREMRGWAGRLMIETGRSLGPLNYYNLGIPGQSTAAVAERLNELAPRLPVGADNRLILSFGVEDTALEDGKPVLSNQQSVAALKQILLQTRPHYKMLMVGPPPVYDPQRNARIKRLNTLFHALCMKARVPYISIAPALQDDIDYRRDLVKNGKTYPSDIGYRKIYELILNDRSWWFN
ncbi:GDSL-type esterase/lipase family protein [Reinekea marinisedimentorum]|uniref:GDSL-like lipase/acylhydrolase family protein n=1 Tax=Reinekea marinisedimentorum TaxID=230495 RepID=A0A4V2UK67_9GAMM|nr:GDSL-type esterase/lipase family protein [Reinekea marinisedimentorum]TCS43002.1 GDSL-like lipase/acylhydrolase family protein [Reinekea marinisedimentorum]